jgi:dTMP kinase
MPFIVIEGSDRFGKSTQLDLLVVRLREMGHQTARFSFPFYNSKTGEIIDAHLHDKLALKEYDPLRPSREADRSRHDALVFQCVQTCNKYEVAAEISNHLRQGDFVVSGRWWQSAYVYGLDDGLDASWLDKVHACLPKADLNILLDFDPELASKRAEAPGDRYESDLFKQKRVRELYLKLWTERPDCGDGMDWPVVSAAGSADEVHERIYAKVFDRFSILAPSRSVR